MLSFAVGETVPKNALRAFSNESSAIGFARFIQVLSLFGRRRRPYADRLTGEATFAEKIAQSQDRHHRFLANVIYDGEPHAAFLDVQHILGGIALREDRFFFPKLCELSRQSCRIEEHLGIESGLPRGFCFGINLGRGSDCLHRTSSNVPTYHNLETRSNLAALAKCESAAPQIAFKN